MKLFRPMVLAMMAGLLLSSCIKEEALNAEADITDVMVDGTTLVRKPVITNNEVLFYVNGWEDLTNLAPMFKLTEGAKIEPESGTKLNFTQPQSYTVTSQDGQWKKTYKVSFVSNDVATDYHFETLKVDSTSKYHTFVDKTADGNLAEWGSGNSGVSFLMGDSKATEYPTSQADNGYVGKCLKLTTVSTGFLGAMFGAPIAAGNLFTGDFQIDMGNPAKSTHFGRPFYKMPKELIGYYKYKAGEKFQDKDKKDIKGRKDSLAIYAVLFETGDGVEYLDGTNSLTSDRIVLLAQLKNAKETDEWTRFSISFEPVAGRTVDSEKLKMGKYSLAIIMSSSKDGAFFNGAVGSTLYVDELKLYSE